MRKEYALILFALLGVAAILVYLWLTNQTILTQTSEAQSINSSTPSSLTQAQTPAATGRAEANTYNTNQFGNTNMQGGVGSQPPSLIQELNQGFGFMFGGKQNRTYEPVPIQGTTIVVTPPPRPPPPPPPVVTGGGGGGGARGIPM